MEENKNLFTEEEWKLIENNQELTKKIYMIGVINKKFVENWIKSGELCLLFYLICSIMEIVNANIAQLVEQQIRNL